MAIASNPNGLRVVTGGQAGSLDVQFILIRCYNSAFTINSIASNSYEYISDANDGFAQIIAVVQDFAEIYYISKPDANSGGENDLTRVIVAINPNTARGLPTDLGAYPTTGGRWTELETALNDKISGSDALAYFGLPSCSGGSWTWAYDN